MAETPEATAVPAKVHTLNASNLALLDRSVESDFHPICTIPEPDKNDRAAVLAYAAQITKFMGKASYRASEVYGQKINLVHVFGHPATTRNVDEESGEVTYVPIDRVVLLDDEGNTYECASAGLLQSLAVIFRLPGIGFPQDWTEPLPIVIKSVPVRNTWHTMKIEIWSEEKKGGKK